MTTYNATLATKAFIVDDGKLLIVKRSKEDELTCRSSYFKLASLIKFYIIIRQCHDVKEIFDEF